MNFANLVTNIFFTILLVFGVGLSFSFWFIAIKVLQKLDKLLDLKIIESEIKIDKF